MRKQRQREKSCLCICVCVCASCVRWGKGGGCPAENSRHNRLFPCRTPSTCDSLINITLTPTLTNTRRQIHNRHTSQVTPRWNILTGVHTFLPTGNHSSLSPTCLTFLDACILSESNKTKAGAFTDKYLCREAVRCEPRDTHLPLCFAIMMPKGQNCK